jgi:hypothetical protein
MVCHEQTQAAMRVLPEEIRAGEAVADALLRALPQDGLRAHGHGTHQCTGQSAALSQTAKTKTGDTMNKAFERKFAQLKSKHSVSNIDDLPKEDRQALSKVGRREESEGEGSGQKIVSSGGRMFWHKYEERLAKDISTLQAESEVLQPGERNRHNEDREAIVAELELFKTLLGKVEKFSQSRMRLAVTRMERATER